ncbi:MAG TPA: MarR family transcriptional regulator, partial [Roseobacter sp.]|nr:MarR family transcriptional regulator [Roseobacter sp.]
LAMDKSQLSRLIKSLVAKKLIKRTSDPVDARATMIHVTGKGHMVHDRLLKEVVRRSETELAPLSGEELRQLNDLLERLTEHNLGLLHKHC